MATIAIANPTVIVNNNTVAIVPNSAAYTEGFGEQKLRAASSGGGGSSTVYSQNIESYISMVKFAVYNTAANIEMIRGWKTNANANAITLSDAVSGWNRTFQNAALTNNYDVTLGADTVIECEFHSDPSV